MADRSWPLLVRRARASDEQAVLAFASATWDGWDYIPHAWPVWLAADDGVMLIACNPADDVPVAISRVAMVSPTEAWLEGIRVNPATRGMNVATDLQVAELHWAAAQGANVIRYATGARNEASHHLGARHGIELLFAYRNYWWSPDPDKEPDDPSAFDPQVRAAATTLRGKVLDTLAAEGWIAAARDADELWRLIDADATFNAAQRLYEPRPWAMAELTGARFRRHVERGEVIASSSGDALAILTREQLPGEDSSLRLAVVGGDADRIITLLDRVRALAGKTVRFRLAENSPLRTSGHEAFLAAGYKPSDWTLHMLGRPIDSDHPVPDIDPATLTLADPPTPLIHPPD